MAKVCERVEECDGLDKLEALQQHESTAIYETAYKIIDEFFHDDEEETGLELDETKPAIDLEMSKSPGMPFKF